MSSSNEIPISRSQSTLHFLPCTGELGDCFSASAWGTCLSRSQSRNIYSTVRYLRLKKFNVRQTVPTNSIFKLPVVFQSCLTLCNPMDYSTPDFHVLHYLPEFAQTHVHWVSDAIQPSHPLSSPSPAFNLSQHQSLIKWVSSSHQVAKVLELQLQHQSFQCIIRVNFLLFWWVWSPCCPRDSQESSPAQKFESINPSAFSLLYGPTLTSVHDYWKNHGFDFTWSKMLMFWKFISNKLRR